jgi:hypothetical protein
MGSSVLQPSAVYRSTAIGWHARQLLRARRQAVILGVTSRGVFVQTSPGVIYLSAEAERGPLTVNLSDDPGWLAAVQLDTVCVVDPPVIRLLPSGLTLDLGQAMVWRTPRRAAPAEPADRQRERLARLSRHASDPGSVNGMACLTGWIARGCPEASRPAHPHAGRCAALGRAVAEGDVDALRALVEQLLGWGHGLTPSADDFVVGLLLALARSGEAVPAARTLLEAAARLVDRRGSGRTSALSVALLACAALGEADERLMALVDHVQTGVPGEAEARVAASSWGATSGWDALAGIGVTLAAFVSQPEPNSRTS